MSERPKRKFKVGDFVRHGGDWGIVRVVDVWPSERRDDDYIFSGVLCSDHKFHKRGTMLKIEWASEYQIEKNPSAFAREHGFPFVADTPVADDFKAIYRPAAARAAEEK